MSEVEPRAGLPRLKGRGRIAPAAPVAVEGPPRPPLFTRARLGRLLVALLLAGALGAAWHYRGCITEAAPLFAHKLEAELGNLAEAVGRLLQAMRRGGESGPGTPTPGPGGPTGPVDLARFKTAGPEGALLQVPGGVSADLRPGTRYAVSAGGLELYEGGALVRLPRQGGTVGLRGGLTLSGSDGLTEVRIESDGSGTIDALGAPLTVAVAQGRGTAVQPLERYAFPDAETEDYPPAEAELFLKRAAWFAAGPSGNPRTIAQDLARRSLDKARGSEREQLARTLLELSVAWAGSARGRDGAL